MLTPAVHLSGTHTRVRPDNLHLHRRAAADEHPRPATHPAPPLMRSCRRGNGGREEFLERGHNRVLPNTPYHARVVIG